MLPPNSWGKPFGRWGTSAAVGGYSVSLLEERGIIAGVIT